MKTIPGFSSLFCAAALAFLASSLPQQADAALFTYKSTCEFGCVTFGLASGDPISGSIEVSDAAIIGGGTVDTADVLAFSFTFGTFAIDNTTAVDFYFDGTLDGSATAFTSYSFGASDAFAPTDLNTFFFQFDFLPFADQGIFGPGNCTGPCTVNTIGVNAALDSARTTADSSLSLAAVPEPATLALFAIALGGLGFMTRRRMA